MRAVDVIRKKRDGGELDPAEIDAFVRGATSGDWPDYQLAALLMAIVCRGMTGRETAQLTAAMTNSGVRVDLGDLPGPKVDKHSTGGVGDKTSLILAPLAAACGVVVPMMSGRGLGHTGGTLDKLESIPGFRVGLSLREFRDTLRRIGLALIGQTAEIAPADRILYALRDVTGTVESIPLITASILSKKIAEGIGGLVMDVKCGRGAFMKTREDARALADSLVANGEANGVRTVAILSSMHRPLGRAVGNSLEVIESLQVLRGAGPEDLMALSVHLAARMVLVGGLASTLGEAEKKVRNALHSGKGIEKFRAVVEAQGGDPRIVDDVSRLPAAASRRLLNAEQAGMLLDIDAEKLGRGCMILGAGRNRADEKIDHSAGAILVASVGDRLNAGDPLAELHYSDPARLEAALPLLREAFVVGEGPPEQPPLLLDTVNG